VEVELPRGMDSELLSSVFPLSTSIPARWT